MKIRLSGFDIETTGLKQEDGHRIIEIALVLFEVDTETLAYERKGAFIRRINPQRPIDPGAQAVHHISFEQLVDCPTIEEVAPDFVRVVKASHALIAHNGKGFDEPFVRGELRRIGMAAPRMNLIDTMLEGTWATPLGKRPSLKELCFACGVEYDTEKAHAAEYDVCVMMECYFAGLKEGFFKLPEVVA